MAIKKFLFMNGTEGFAQEQGSLDELSLGKLTLAGIDGVAVDAGSAKIVNLGAPVLSTDAARKSEVDAAAAAAAQALQAEADARIASDEDLMGQIAEEAGFREAADNTLQGNITAEANTRASADATLQNNINSEASARQTADGQLQAAITAEANTRASADSVLSSAISTEQGARIAADNTLQSNIDAEAIARAAADTTLQGNINTAVLNAAQALATETQARIDGDAALASDLSDEVDARVAADTALQAEIDAEEVARAQAVSALTTAIQNEAQTRANADADLASDLSDETAARVLADSNLQSAINAEAGTRLAADNALQSDLSTETQARIDGDAALTSALSNEASLRSTADQTLQQNINNETAARIGADNAITTAYEAADAQIVLDYIAADAVVLSDAMAYTDSVASGFYVKAPVKAIATGAITLSGTQTVDGVALVAADRVLVAGQADASANGIYVVASGAWARSPDANVSAEVKDGMSVFVEQGTVNADSTWVLVTNNPIVLGTTELEFRQFSGLGQVVAGDGLSKSGNVMSVNVGDGVEIASDAVAVKLAVDPGLMFSGGALDAKVDGARAMAKDSSGLYVKFDGAKGLAMDASLGLGLKLEADAGMEFDPVNGGLELKLFSADRLVKVAGGLDVTGVPSLFKVAGVATNASVSAAALNTMTGDSQGSGLGDGYHGHARLTTAFAATAGIDQGKAVYVNSAGYAVTASCSATSTARVVGLVHAGQGGLTPRVTTSGYISGGISGLTPGEPYYLGATGSPVLYSALQSGDRVIRLGFARAANMLHVAIQDMGQKA